VAVAVDDEGVGKRQRDQPLVGAGDAGGLGEGPAGRQRVEQIAFQIDDLGRGDQVGVDVVWLEQRRRA
jgi:hypothetical protein